MTDTKKDDAAAVSTPVSNKARSVDHHEIEHGSEKLETGDKADALRKSGDLPLEAGNQYSHHKPEKN